MALQTRLFEPTAVRAGDRVTCDYRGRHEGVVLSALDPRAWEGTLAFGEKPPTVASVREHVEGLAHRGLIDDAWRRKAPILWDFGKVYWDKVEALTIQRRGDR